MLSLKIKKAQSTAEYVIVLALVVAAVTAMQVYVRRGLQGRVRDASDYVDNTREELEGATRFVPTFNTDHYEPTELLSSDFATERRSNAYEAMREGGNIERASIGNEEILRHGYEGAAEIDAGDKYR